jgi:DNA replication and repair protein RecF
MRYRESEENDVSSGRTLIGIHRDDYHFMLDERSAKKYGSQGQQKSLIIALKLAQYHFLARRKNRLPLILLDDIFDKLDIDRIKKLLCILEEDGMGQVFITDARISRTRELISEIKKDVSIFEVKQGKVEKIQ